MVSANINSMKVYQFGGAKNIQPAHFSVKNQPVNNNSSAVTQPAFRGDAYNTTAVRTSSWKRRSKLIKLKISCKLFLTL